MESKINYHALTMDEIVFDNRNKTYGAFILRKTSERNQLKAIFIVGGFFISAFLIPTLLKSLGLFVETIKKEETTVIKMIDDKIFEKIDPKKTDVKDPATKQDQTTKQLDDKDREMLATKDSIPASKDPEPKKDPDDLSIGALNPNLNMSGPTGPTQPSNTGQPGGNGNHTKGILDPHFKGEMPEFIGGQEAMDIFIEEHLIYPTRASDDEIEGICEIRFVVNADGTLEQISVSNSSNNKYLDAAALDVVKKMPRFKPGKQNDQAVRVWCIIPITFSLNR